MPSQSTTRSTSRRPRDLRGLDRLHGRARGGVRDPRSRRRSSSSTASRSCTTAACATRCSPTSVAGELIATEIEIRSGRGETFAEAAERQRERRRAAVRARRRAWGSRWRRPAPTPGPTTSTSSIIDTQHYRRLERGAALGRPAQQHLEPARPRRRPRRRSRRSPSATGCASCCRRCWRSRPTRPSSTAATPACTRCAPRSSPAPSRAAASPSRSATGPTYADFVELLERTGSIVESTQLWWSVRPHHAFGTVEVRICDAQTRGDESLRAGRADRRLRRPGGARLRRAAARRRRAAAAPARDRGEPLAGDPLRPGRRDDRLRARREVPTRRGARATARVDRRRRAQALGLDVGAARSATAPSARYARSPRARPIEEIYRDAVAETRSDLRTASGARSVADAEQRRARSRGAAPPRAERPARRARRSCARQLEEELRKVRVEDVLLQSVVSILNLAARRLAKDDERDLEQAQGRDRGRAGAASTCWSPRPSAEQLRRGALRSCRCSTPSTRGEGEPPALSGRRARRSRPLREPPGRASSPGCGRRRRTCRRPDR